MSWKDILRKDDSFAERMAEEYKKEFGDSLETWILREFSKSPEDAINVIEAEMHVMNDDKPTGEKYQYHPENPKLGYTYGPYGSPEEWQKLYDFFERKLEEAKKHATERKQ